jgi:hypothetical protein
MWAGACPNIACLPSKNIIHTAQIAHYVRNSEEFGITINGFTVKMPVVRERKRRMVQGLVDTHLDLYHQSGAELMMASGRFIGPRMLEATLADGTKRVLRGENLVIGTGTRAAADNTPGLQDAKPLTDVEALELDVVPEHLIVLGVAMLASSSHRRCAVLAAKSPWSIATSVCCIVKMTTSPMVCIPPSKMRESIWCSTPACRVYREHRDNQSVERTLEGSHLLVAAGRVPNTENIGVEFTGVELTNHGYVRVNDRSKPLPKACGPLERWQVVPNSHTSARMTSAWSATTFSGAIIERPADRCRSVSSLTPSLRVSVLVAFGTM